MFNRQPHNAAMMPLPVRRHSFLSALAWGGSAAVIALIASVTIIVTSGMSLIDRKSNDVLGLVHEALGTLPELVDSLPPALADALNDERRTDYTPQIQLSAKLAAPDPNGWVRPTIEITNAGDRVVSLLSLRVVLVTADGEVLDERNSWAATPIAADDEWRGPLLPGSTRRLSPGCFMPRGQRGADDVDVAVELTDLRVWKGPVVKTAERDGEADVRVASTQP
ncbi:MAG: hypothetical protein C4547_12545 [Phycisphaerales bacterium]|nr:MAG: hypothetical protein C4547_12545 [Phycisphaerales bacterium]